MTVDAPAWYDAHAGEVLGGYEAVDPARLHAWLADMLPEAAALVVDVGAGSGRDAAWLAGLGHQVLAVEPSSAMREAGQALHPSERIRWLDDRLPALEAVARTGVVADLVLLAASWQHVPPALRAQAFASLAGLLRPGGLLAITLRQGPCEDGRHMHPVSLDEVERLGQAHRMTVLRVEHRPDRARRAGVSWTNVALRLADDGTQALPLLRHLVLDQPRSATYKLGLLRALCRAADGSAGLAREEGGHVLVPLGLLALTWLRLYRPLVEAGLPQRPGNRGPDGLGFAGAGFRALLGGAPATEDMRVGLRLEGVAARTLHAALREAADTIVSMPLRFMSLPDGGPVLSVRRGRAPVARDALVLDAACLRAFGEVEVPQGLWRALGRFASWVEPSLVAEWARMMAGYAADQGRRLEEGLLASALAWKQPDRDSSGPRAIALRLLDAGQGMQCVWTGRRLDASTLDVDHCLPWSAWPCSDLWNLVPAHRAVNRRDKRGRLPSALALEAGRERILAWWERAYVDAPASVLAWRFEEEARSSLPAIAAARPAPQDVFGGLALQRLRLWADQRVPEWQPGGRGAARAGVGASAAALRQDHAPGASVPT